MADLEEIAAKLDQLLALANEEVGLLPDALYPGLSTEASLQLTTNQSVPLRVRFRIEDREGGRYLRMQLFDGMHSLVIDRAWRCVFRDPMTGAVYDRPGMFS